MQPPSLSVVPSLHSKALASGLSHVLAQASTSFLINFQGQARGQKNFAVVTCRGTEEQEEAFRRELTKEEGEDLDVNRVPRGEGDECPEIKVWATGSGEEKTFRWLADDPTVYLLYFWTSWSEYCQQPMSLLQEIQLRNPDWQGRVEIITISIDDRKELAEAKIQEKGWTKAGSYWGTEECFRDEAPAMFSMHHLIDACVLVKKGKIRWRGYQSGRDIETDIKQLLVSDDLPQTDSHQPSKSGPVYHGEELEQSLTRVDRLLADFTHAHPTVNAPFFVYTVTDSKCGEEITTFAQSYVKGSVLTKYRGDVEALQHSITEVFPATEFEIGFQDSVPEIVRGEKCVLCNKVLTEADVQYLCPYCEPKHYHCQDCEDVPRDGTGSAKFAHPHKVYKLTALSSHLSELRYGSNLPKEEILTDDPSERVHQCFCENRYAVGGCEGKVEGARFKCAHCLEFDLCETCEKLFWTGASEEMKGEVKQKGHQEFHVLIKIPFPKVD